MSPAILKAAAAAVATAAAAAAAATCLQAMTTGMAADRVGQGLPGFLPPRVALAHLLPLGNKILGAATNTTPELAAMTGGQIASRVVQFFSAAERTLVLISSTLTGAYAPDGVH